MKRYLSITLHIVYSKKIYPIKSLGSSYNCHNIIFMGEISYKYISVDLRNKIKNKHKIDILNYVPDNDSFILADYVIDITPRFHFKYKDEYVTIHRGEEIQHIIYKYRWKYEELGVDRLTNYLILDDDTDMLLWHAEHFVKTDTYEGITEDDVKKSIDILNNEKLYIK